MRAKLKEVKKELRRRMHQPIPEQGRWLAQVVRGYFAYHAVPTNGLRIKHQPQAVIAGCARRDGHPAGPRPPGGPSEWDGGRVQPGPAEGPDAPKRSVCWVG